ncbi:MAG: DNA mismatch repair protein MutS [Candidatus Caenarcaniphilales bacterium]|nr:DNA mismatch repair protein MutS [Candidatus Caenarcaniphilales bacterium]
MNFPSPEGYTPILQQYLEQRAKTGDAILFFRLGDFYECFFSDAELIAKELEITLTSKGDSAHPGGKVPMAGIPVKSAENYISRLLKAGFKVAVCEQVGDATGKGPMKRELVRILTPGTLVESEFLEGEKANYLACIFPSNPNKTMSKQESELWGLAFVDISTAELKITEVPENQLLLELSRINPSELLFATIRIKDPERITIERKLCPAGLSESNYSSSTRAINHFDFNVSVDKIKERFGSHSLAGFGCAHFKAGLQALGGLLDYLEYTCNDSLKSLSSIQVYEVNDSLKLDEQSVRNLEIFETMQTRTKKGSLLGLFEENLTTKMGTRMMREWLSYPLLDVSQIRKRQQYIAKLIANQNLLNNLKVLLSQVTDLERLNIKLKTERLNPRELGWIKNTLLILPGLKALLQDIASTPNDEEQPDIFEIKLSNNLIFKAKELDLALQDELPIVSGDSGIFRKGYSEKLDQMKDLVDQNEVWLTNYEAKEKERTNCKFLKVCFNKAAGFYIELTKANKHLAPEDYKIKQNLTNVDRYITKELKDYESQFLLAEANLKSIEQELFIFLRESLSIYCEEIHALSKQIAKIDCFVSLASLAINHNYVAPNVDNSYNLSIKDGRHPVIENLLPKGHFVGNDLWLESRSEQQVIILTGPNMSGKSTFMKQIAILCLMAQIGSYVPAQSAQIGIVDRIFTRIGASDDLSQGQSTFMVEMTETAYLLNNLTERSLVLLDEIGRGTSTYDGVAIAWSVAEYLAKSGPRSIFATHYHEMNGLADIYSQVVNYQVSVHESTNELIFLHKVLPGGADKSYGIEVARMAGIPKEVLNRAQGIMAQMNAKNSTRKTTSIKDCAEQAKLELGI